MFVVDHPDFAFDAAQFDFYRPAERFVLNMFSVLITEGFVGHVPKSDFGRPPEGREAVGPDPLVDVDADGVAAVHLLHRLPGDDIGESGRRPAADEGGQSLFLELGMPV